MRPVYIFDLDGTLSNAEHRVHHLEGETKDWDAFYAACGDDAPIVSTIRTMRNLMAAGCEVWVWTGRRADQVHTTIDWLTAHAKMPQTLRMRPDGDWTPDTDLKRRWLEELPAEQRERIVAVFEDRKSVVDMWRAQGLTCYQVAPGEF